MGIVNIQGHTRDILLPSMRRCTVSCDLKTNEAASWYIVLLLFKYVFFVLQALANQVCFVNNAVIIYDN